MVDLSDAIASQLAELGSSAIQVPEAIEQLHALLLHAVPSTIGLSITIRICDVDLTLTTSPEGVAPQSSLRVPLSMWVDFEAGSEAVFYAAKAGSMVDLAAELGWTLGLNIVWTGRPADPVLIVDQHLTPVPGFSGLDDLSAVQFRPSGRRHHVQDRLPGHLVSERHRCSVIAQHPALDALIDRRCRKGVAGRPSSVCRRTAC